MSTKTYSVSPVTGLRPSTRRTVVFLESREDISLDARQSFESLNGNRDREIRTRFDHWIDGGTNDRWFHGWPNDHRYKDCFVFKWKEDRHDHRLYGFLCNPKSSNRGFRACVLVFHATKKERDTDRTELARVGALSTNRDVITAIAKQFSENRGGKQ